MDKFIINCIKLIGCDGCNQLNVNYYKDNNHLRCIKTDKILISNGELGIYI